LIFVTVGNATQPFPRLLNAVDELARSGCWGSEEVFIQSGNNPGFCPLYSRHRPFLSMEEFVRYINDARLVISHGGCGTLLHAIRAKKCPVVMPRKKQYGEHINDHQVQLVRALADEGKLVPVYRPDELESAIALANSVSMGEKDRGCALIALVGRAIRETLAR
jgi:UDP-N-acetylglucosamine transferase subunit ALG13